MRFNINNIGFILDCIKKAKIRIIILHFRFMLFKKKKKSFLLSFFNMN